MLPSSYYVALKALLDAPSSRLPVAQFDTPYSSELIKTLDALDFIGYTRDESVAPDGKPIIIPCYYLMAKGRLAVDEYKRERAMQTSRDSEARNARVLAVITLVIAALTLIATIAVPLMLRY